MFHSWDSLTVAILTPKAKGLWHIHLIDLKSGSLFDKLDSLLDLL